MATKKKFSIVVPTYSGQATIVQMFDSLLRQDSSGLSWEIVVVIDGPNDVIKKIVTAQQQRFIDRQTAFKLKQFKTNRGRFAARIAGAKLAQYEQLLFVDDRVSLYQDYFKCLKKINTDLALANVIETNNSTNLISKTLYCIRRRAYGQKWGQDFKDYYIDASNFETSPKGTTSLWINRKLFLDACDQVQTSSRSNKYVNEDTKILRAIIDAGHSIFRTNSLKVYYQPRANFSEAIRHLYERGPRFVDYYLRPGRRFFPVLLLVYVCLAAVIVTAILSVKLLAYVLVGMLALVILGAVVLAKNPREYIDLIGGLILVGLIFSAGIIKGTILKLKS